MREFFLVAMLAVAAAALSAVAFFLIYGRAETWTLILGNPDLGAFDRSAPFRSPRPNDALLCTPGLCGAVAVDGQLPEYDILPDELIRRIDRAMEASGEIFRRVDDGSDPASARYVTWTPLMRFPDSGSFEAVRLPDGKTGLVAYSAARIGYGDRGVNLARLKRLTGRLTAR